MRIKIVRVDEESNILKDEEIEIALAEKGDIEEIISVLKRSFSSFENPEGTKKLLLLSKTLVAKAHGRIVGTVSYTNLKCINGKVTEMPHYKKNKKFLIFGLAVLPEYRNRGIATILVREAERYMRREKAQGYFGNADTEEIAQWWVSMFGVKLMRLAPKR
ncbi:MAG: GNAT family N-acetyltransferase, partial [Fervidobacterium sp.]